MDCQSNAIRKKDYRIDPESLLLIWAYLSTAPFLGISHSIPADGKGMRNLKPTRSDLEAMLLVSLLLLAIILV